MQWLHLSLQLGLELAVIGRAVARRLRAAEAGCQASCLNHVWLGRSSMRTIVLVNAVVVNARAVKVAVHSAA